MAAVIKRRAKKPVAKKYALKIKIPVERQIRRAINTIVADEKFKSKLDGLENKIVGKHISDTAAMQKELREVSVDIKTELGKSQNPWIRNRADYLANQIIENLLTKRELGIAIDRAVSSTMQISKKELDKIEELSSM